MAGHAAAKARMGNPETELCRSLNNVPYSSTLPFIRVQFKDRLSCYSRFWISVKAMITPNRGDLGKF